MAPRRFTLRTLSPGDARAKILPEAIDAPLDASIEHDGQRINCRAGEPLALSLLAAGHTTLARSPKYHRPRGAMCLRGACEGCLVRVDGVPDVMACRVRVRDGMRVESQNAFPSASIDVFRVTDWFFPKHMDHHHLMVAMGRALNDTMQVFARRMAGLGTLPDDIGPEYVASKRQCDVLVVGAGSAGIAAANALSRKGLDVLCVDEEPAPGGFGRDASDAAVALEAIEESVTFLPEHTAVASFVNGTLVMGETGLTQVRARARLFANGCHETVGTFAQNDLPGIYTARAAMRALRAGVSLGRNVVLVGALPGMSSLADALRAVGAKVTHVTDGAVQEAHGARSVTGVTVRGEKLGCDALVVGVEPQASYELAGQCGAELEWSAARGCFAPAADAAGRTRTAGVYVAGSLRRAALPSVGDNVRASREDGARVAESIAMDLAGRDWEEAQR